MKRTLVFTLACHLTLAALAATSPPAPARLEPRAKPAREARFLFVVDTSSSMKSLDPATRQTVFDLIFSGIDGYMRTGDTFGLWTFAEEVGAGKFPMQVWNSEKPMEGANRAATFVRGQEYKGENRMEELMQRLSAVIRTVGDVNVLLISDGEERMEGTGVDGEINGAYAQRAKERKAARKPFVTTLVAEGGRIVSGTVTLPGETIPLPPRPQAQKGSAQRVPSGTTNGAVVPGSSTAPVDHKAQATGAIPGGAVAAGASTTPAPAVIPSLGLPAGNQTESRVEALNSAVVPGTPDAPIVGSVLASDANPPLPPSDAPAARPRKVIQIITKPSASVPSAEPGPAETVADTDTNTAPQTAAAAVTPAVSQFAPPLAPPSQPSSRASGSSFPPEEPAIATRLVKATEHRISDLPSKTIVVAARESAAATPVPNEPKSAPLAAMQVQSGLGAIPTLILGGILLAMSLFLLGIALRRMRHESQGSLITQSMHRR
jgi:hypothetical protein